MTVGRDDWRLRIEIGQDGLLGHTWLSEADTLKRDLDRHRIEASEDGGTVFVYTSSSLELERARKVIEQELERLELEPKALVSGHWLHDEERWVEQ
jgi:hypothetical protein